MKTGMDKINKAFLFAGLEKAEYTAIQQDLIKRNQINLKGLSAITSVYMLVMLLLSFRSSISAANRMHFIWCLCICTGIFGVMLLGVVKSRTATLVAVYLYLGTLFAYGIAIGITQTAQTSVSFLIFIMVGPLLFYDRPIKLSSFVLIFTIIFLTFSAKIKSPVARDTDLINGVSYGVISLFITAGSMIIKIKRVWLERKMHIMAETDALTNLKNRNCFEAEYQNCAMQAEKNVVCIYIDANGLHKLNNTKGHDAGDEMLRYLALQIVDLFGRENAYRVGGDEYMIFSCDEELADVNQKTEELLHRMEENQYSISIGAVSAPVEGLNMDDLIKKADVEMYQAKRKYYDQAGFDRRRR